MGARVCVLRAQAHAHGHARALGAAFLHPVLAALLPLPVALCHVPAPVCAPWVRVVATASVMCLPWLRP